MTEGRDGVGSPMTDAAAAPRSAFPVRLLAVGLGLVLLADLPDPIGPFTRGDVLRGVLLPFLAATAGVLAILQPGREGPRGGALLLLLLPLAVPLTAAIGAVSPSASMLLRHAATWIALACLSPGLARVWADAEDAARTWTVLAWAGALAGLWVLGDAALRLAPGVGPFGRTGVAGPVLAALVPASVLRVRGPIQVRIVVPALVAGGCVVTASRVGIIAMVLGAFAAIVPAAPAGRRWQRLGAVAGFVALLAAGLVAANRLKVPTGGTTLAVRTGLWKASATLVSERPLLGHGTSSFPAEVLRVRDIEEAGLSRGRRPMVAHNDVLHAAAEGGVPAGLALAAWMALVLLVGLAAWRRSPHPAVPPAFGAFLVLAVSSLGEDVLLDPAGALLAATAAATLVLVGARAPSRSPRGLPLLLGLLALASLGAAAVKARDLLADVDIRRYRDVIRGGVDPDTAEKAAKAYLEKGALAWRPDHPEAWYWIGTEDAERQRYDDARIALRKALAADPGRTEALLNIAKSYEAEERYEDAKAALLEARRRDPTRYDVHMRLGHLALGPEPVPGDGVDASFDPIEAHRHYNAAERVGPGRFETWVARARIARRTGRLDASGEMLRKADAIQPKAPETVLEAFRLAEVERQPDLLSISVLGLALLANPDLATLVHLEADRFLAEGRLREEAAKRAAKGTLAPPDYAAANRAFEAAARRYAALLHAGYVKPEELIAWSDADVEIGGYRAALARLLALLTWTSPESKALGKTRADRLHALAEIRLRAARAATRIDATQARLHYAEAHKTEAAYFVEVGDWGAARTTLLKATKESPDDARLRLALARALVRTGDLEEAETHLLKALDLKPEVKPEIVLDDTLAPLRTRPKVADALR